MDFTSVYASGSGFASADTRFGRNASLAATAPLKSTPVTPRPRAGQRKGHHVNPPAEPEAVPTN